jgi:hypothetical protein
MPVLVLWPAAAAARTWVPSWRTIVRRIYVRAPNRGAPNVADFTKSSGGETLAASRRRL